MRRRSRIGDGVDVEVGEGEEERRHGTGRTKNTAIEAERGRDEATRPAPAHARSRSAPQRREPAALLEHRVDVVVERRERLVERRAPRTAASAYCVILAAMRSHSGILRRRRGRARSWVPERRHARLVRQRRPSATPRGARAGRPSARGGEPAARARTRNSISCHAASFRGVPRTSARLAPPASDGPGGRAGERGHGRRRPVVRRARRAAGARTRRGSTGR